MMRAVAARLTVAMALLLAANGTALAQSEGSVGIAIANAVEESFYACHGDNADRTLACARAKCREAAGAGVDCYRVRWCFPALWSGAMSYLANREVTLDTFLCGAPTEAGLKQMLAAHCAAEPAASECRLVAVWSPDGTETARTDLLGKNTVD